MFKICNWCFSVCLIFSGPYEGIRVGAEKLAQSVILYLCELINSLCAFFTLNYLNFIIFILKKMWGGLL